MNEELFEEYINNLDVARCHLDYMIEMVKKMRHISDEEWRGIAGEAFSEKLDELINDLQGPAVELEEAQAFIDGMLV